MSREKRIVEDGYDAIAEKYAEARTRMSHGDKKYLRLLTGCLPEGSKILDLGCGSGVPIAKFLVKHYEVTGVDISGRQIELARECVPEAAFLVGDMTDISFPDEAFDAIVSFAAIIHVPREEHADLFREMYRMLKESGLILLTLGTTDWVSSPEDRFFGAKMYWSHYDSETYRRIVERTGFTIIQSSIEAEKFHGVDEETFYVLARKVDTSDGM